MSFHLESPAVSVVVPVFNTAAYLEQCLDSLVAQSLTNIEIICVDNGSTDDSLEILRAYERRYRNIVFLEHKEGKQSGARNAGIDVAQGHYIGFVDSDDFVNPEMFAHLYRAAVDTGACVSVCNGIAFTEMGRSSRPLVPDEYLSAKRSFNILEKPELLRNTTICNKLYSADFICRHSLRFPEGLVYEDMFFVILSYLCVRSIVAVPEQLYHYRQNRPGSTTTNRGSNVFDIFEVMGKTEAEVERRLDLHKYLGLLYETMVVKYIHLMNSTPKTHRKAYYNRMRAEVARLPISAEREIMKSREYREYGIIRACNFLLYDSFVKLRQLYGRIRVMAGLG